MSGQVFSFLCILDHLFTKRWLFFEKRKRSAGCELLHWREMNTTPLWRCCAAADRQSSAAVPPEPTPPPLPPPHHSLTFFPVPNSLTLLLSSPSCPQWRPWWNLTMRLSRTMSWAWRWVTSSWTYGGTTEDGGRGSWAAAGGCSRITLSGWVITVRHLSQPLFPPRQHRLLYFSTFSVPETLHKPTNSSLIIKLPVRSLCYGFS